MFFSIREQKENNFGEMLHSVWREDFKVTENLVWLACLEFLLDKMLEYDTMQVKNIRDVWYDVVWSKLDIKNYIESSKSFYSTDLTW